MHQYFIKTPWIVKYFFPSYVWNIPTNEKVVYLTFDDGPTPGVTPWVLNELKKYNALATFFCIGSNVVQHPDIFQQITDEGHAIGNHTQNHYNGWKINDETYLKDVSEAAQHLSTNLFRPPYGRIKTSQAKKISAAMGVEAKIIMWDVLSADFDPAFSKEKCLENVLKNFSEGSIIVFHDSEKAFPNLEYILPIILKELNNQQYQFKRITDDL